MPRGTRRFIQCTAFLLAATIFAGTSVAQDDGEFSFALFADTPYDSKDDRKGRYLVDELSKMDLAWVAHLGGFGPCTDYAFTENHKVYSSQGHPLIYTPGDNEWTNCHESKQSPLERLTKIRQVFFSESAVAEVDATLGVVRQSTRPEYPAYVENARWEKNGVVFATLHVVGSQNGLEDFPGRTDADSDAQSERDRAAVAWLRDAFIDAKQRDAKAVFLMMHGSPGLKYSEGRSRRRGYEPIIGALLQEVMAFPRPVVLAHGDTGDMRLDMPLRNPTSYVVLANFRRLELFASPDVGYLRVTVRPDTSDVFTFAAYRVDRKSAPYRLKEIRVRP